MDIYNEILSALQTEEQVMLATIISTTGSTPAASLSKMLMTRGGMRSVGTVGGGCMEGEVFLHAHRLFGSGKSEMISFHLNEDDVQHGLICGGSLDVLIEPLTREHIPLVAELKSLREEGEDCVLMRVWKNNETTDWKLILRGDNQEKWNDGAMENLQPINPLFHRSFSDLLRRTVHRRETSRMTIEEGEIILEPIAGTPGLFIFGGGHVSKYVSRAASMAGFNVTIIDDREKYANKERFPEAGRTLAIDYQEALKELTIKASAYVVIVTRGHAFDEQILEKVLTTPAKYIGMIGSKRKVFTTFGHLAERGTPIDALRRVHAPVGIEIGALTAEEIGISIVAQLINVRRGGDQPLYFKSREMNDMIEQLEQNIHAL